MQSVDYSNTPSIVTGADGFIGQNLVAYFKAHNWPVIPLGRKVCDLTDRAATLAAFKALPQAGRIFHLATYQRTGAVQYDVPGDLLAINSRMHLNMMEAWVTHQKTAKFIGAGSSCAYPVLADPIPETAYQTGKLHDSVRGYGLAKQVLITGAETHAHQYGLKALVCMFATVYGVHDQLASDRSHFVGGMLRRALEDQKAGRNEMLVYGTPQTVREVLYVTDQIEAMLAADAAFDNGLVNAAANTPVTLQHMAETIRSVIGWNASIHFPNAGYAGADRKQLDSSRFLQATGWRPKTGLVEGIGLVAADLKKRLSL